MERRPTAGGQFYHRVGNVVANRPRIGYLSFVNHFFVPSLFPLLSFQFPNFIMTGEGSREEVCLTLSVFLCTLKFAFFRNFALVQFNNVLITICFSFNDFVLAILGQNMTVD